MVGMTEVNLPSIEKAVTARNEIFKSRDAAGLPAYDGTIDSLPAPGDF